MRLGQLARKIDKDTSEIVKFLGKQEITIEDHLNTKIEDNHVELVLEAFKLPEPEETVEEIVESTEENTVETTGDKTTDTSSDEDTITEEEVTVEVFEMTEEEVIESTEEKGGVVVAQEDVDTRTLTVSDLLKETEPETNEEKTIPETEEVEENEIVEFGREDQIPEDITADLIKAPKVELQGIKVVGKIDLPEKTEKEKKKEEERVAAQEESSYTTPSVKTDGIHPSKKSKDIKLKKDFLSPEKVVEETKETKRKKAKEIKAEKKAKGISTKKKKKIDEASLLKQAERERRQRKKERVKNAPKKKDKHWLRQLWDAIK